MTKKTPTTRNPARKIDHFAHLSDRQLMALIRRNCRSIGRKPRVALVDGKFVRLH